jgi:uncharacterized protein (UPF0264 family)
MKLLVSVRTADEARAALAGGADIVDAKDPDAGALGAVRLDSLRLIHAAVCDDSQPRGGASRARPITAALGDASDEFSIERTARAYASEGASLVKVGFAGITRAARVAGLLTAAIRGAHMGNPSSGVIAVAYADSVVAASIAFDSLLEPAALSGVTGVLIDTADKRGPGLRTLIPDNALIGWTRRAHDAGLLVGIAGRLASGDLPWARDIGGDVIGVRGAACDGGRSGRVSAQRVRELHEVLARRRLRPPR